jgi:acyl carrier protein
MPEFTMYDTIREIVIRLRPSAAPLSPHTRLLEDLQLDSLALLELSAQIEDHFSVVVEARHLRRVRTLADVAQLLNELCGSESQRAGQT